MTFYNIVMNIKKMLRKNGYDVVKYHPFYDTVAKAGSIRTIIDIGANDGMWSKEMRTLFPEAQIYAFEPLPDCFKRLNTVLSEDPKFQAFNIALGESEGTMTMERSSFHPSSSLRHMGALHKSLYPKSSATREETVQITRLDSLADTLTITEPLLVKMDVQGFEDSVIRGGLRVLSQAHVIIAETSFIPLYDDQPLFGDIHDLLTPLGFSYHGNCGEHYSPQTSERLYEDSVFIRDRKATS